MAIEDLFAAVDIERRLRFAVQRTKPGDFFAPVAAGWLPTLLLQVMEQRNPLPQSCALRIGHVVVPPESDMWPAAGQSPAGFSSGTRNGWEGISPVAAPAANRAAPAIRAFLWQARNQSGRGTGLGRHPIGSGHPTSVWRRRRDRKGTLIRHALAQPATVVPLAVVMIQPSVGTLLVTTVGATPLPEAGG